MKKILWLSIIFFLGVANAQVGRYQLIYTKIPNKEIYFDKYGQIDDSKEYSYQDSVLLMLDTAKGIVYRLSKAWVTRETSKDSLRIDHQTIIIPIFDISVEVDSDVMMIPKN